MSSPDRELNDFFAALPNKVKAAIKPVLREQANRLADAQRTALRGQLQPPEETGALEASIRVEDGAHELEVLALAGGDATTKNGYDHALAFEFGTSKQPARPFFYPPYRSMKDDIEEKIAAAVTEAIGG